jgi:hypothetical protein
MPRNLPSIQDPEKIRSEQLALGIKITKCLRRQGFADYDADYGPVLFDLSAPFLDDDGTKRRVGYGVVDAISNSTQGGSFVPPPIPSSQQNQQYQSALGVCYQKLLPEFPLLSAVAQTPTSDQPLAELAPTVEADQRMVVLRKRWRKCMAERGIRVENPWSAGAGILTKARTIADSMVDDKSKRVGAKKLRRLRIEEMKIANADADCSQPMAAERDTIWTEYVTAARSPVVDQ